MSLGNGERPRSATGASCLGVLAFLFGILVSAWYANEWMTFAVAGEPPWPIEAAPYPDCDEDELIEEGLTLAECHQMALKIHELALSAPGWYPAFHMGLSAAGMAVALLSMAGGIALVNGRRASGAAAVIFAVMALIEAVLFAGVANTGPMLRQAYFTPLLFLFFLHLAMTVAAVVLRQGGNGDPAGHQVVYLVK